MKRILLLLVSGTLLVHGILLGQSSNAPKGEPTNAKEAAAQKAAAENKIDTEYQELVASLSPEEQAWETTLQENLGSFYLPIHKKQKIQGQSNAWDFIHDDPKLPRILLIGDSISRGYTQAVRKELEGKVNVHRAPANCGPTATGIKKLDIWLGDGNWDLIHFNFGIHDRKTPLTEYEDRLIQIATRLKETGATVIWANTTPIPSDWKEGPEIAKEMEKRNSLAAKVMRQQKIPINDLSGTISPHLPETQNPADVHFNAKGYGILGKQVADFILAALSPAKDR